MSTNYKLHILMLVYGIPFHVLPKRSFAIIFTRVESQYVFLGQYTEQINET